MARHKNITDTSQIRSEAESIEKVLEAMISAGSIVPSEHGYVFQPVIPLKLKGPPLSEQIIVERR